MASSKAYLDFVLEQLSGLEEIAYRAMMGEYILYYRSKIVGGIYDDRLLVKPVPAAVALMPEAAFELPMKGQKKCCWLTMLTARSFWLNCLTRCMTSFLRPRKRGKRLL